MKKIFVFLIFFPSLCLAQEYKISIVNSYNLDHVGERPQLTAIIKSLNSSKNKFIIENYYMLGRTKNIDNIKRKKIAKLIKSDINKFNPDFIITINDLAFKFIGCDLSENYKIIFSGLNTPLIDYNDIIKNSKNISGIKEIINLDEFINILKTIRFQPKTIWFIFDFCNKSINITELFYEEFRLKTNFKLKKKQIKNLSELRKFITKIQNDNRGVLIFLFQSINNDSLWLRKQDILKDVIKFNKKHLEISDNIVCVRDGVAFAIAPHYYEMGIKVANIILNNIETKEWKNLYDKNSTIIAINNKRLLQLNMKDFYKKIIEVVEYSYDNY